MQVLGGAPLALDVLEDALDELRVEAGSRANVGIAVEVQKPDGLEVRQRIPNVDRTKRHRFFRTAYSLSREVERTPSVLPGTKARAAASSWAFLFTAREMRSPSKSGPAPALPSRWLGHATLPEHPQRSVRCGSRM